jgi:hypothetical protein
MRQEHETTEQEQEDKRREHEGMSRGDEPEGRNMVT